MNKANTQIGFFLFMASMLMALPVGAIIVPDESTEPQQSLPPSAYTQSPALPLPMISVFPYEDRDEFQNQVEQRMAIAADRLSQMRNQVAALSAEERNAFEVRMNLLERDRLTILSQVANIDDVLPDRWEEVESSVQQNVARLEAGIDNLEVSLAVR